MPNDLTVKRLLHIVDATSKPGETLLANCREPAKLLRLQSTMVVQWSPEYIHQVASGSLRPSKPLTKAIAQLYKRVLQIEKGKKDKVHGTWVPFLDRDEQDKALSLVPPQRRRMVIVQEAQRREHELQSKPNDSET